MDGFVRLVAMLPTVYVLDTTIAQRMRDAFSSLIAHRIAALLARLGTEAPTRIARTSEDRR